jgi:uncharacterized protein DUF6429
MQQCRDDKAIRTYRLLAELRISELLKKAKSTTTLDDIQRIIFEEVGLPPSHYFAKLLALFHTPETKIDDAVVLQVIQDAWNYFPHFRLNGCAPAEVTAGISPVDVALTQMPDMAGTEFDDDKIDDAVLALLLLGFHGQGRVWKGHDWTVLKRLFQKGYITDPARKAKSVMLTDRGLADAQRLFKKLFGR